MPLWLSILLVLACLAVGLIFALKILCPTAFFKIKAPLGVGLHFITGGKLPPYFSDWPFQQKYFREWCRDGDVVVCVAVKSGTTWIMNIVHQIRTLGDPDNTLKHNTHQTPWPEFLWYPGQTADEALAGLKQLDGMTNPKFPFRVFKSHYKPLNEKVPWKKAFETDEIVPVRKYPKVKYVCCMREGHDVMASSLPFAAAHRQEFKDMWGGFPPTFNSFDAMFRCCTTLQKGWYHGYASLWWPYRNDPNVLMLHYSDLKRDLKSELRRIATFLEVDVPSSKWPLIEEKVSLKWMKENEHIFKYDIPTGFGNVMRENKGAMIRSGTVGQGKAQFTPEQERVWKSLNDKYFGSHPGLKGWILTGGPLPDLTEAEKAKVGSTGGMEPRLKE